MRKWIGFEKGINLGGWFSQCEHTEQHYCTFITEEDFSVFSKWGIDHVRIPIDYELVENEIGEYKDEGFAHIQRAIDWCEKYHLNMILDLHKTAGWSFDEEVNSFFDSNELQERFYRLWDELTHRYAKYSNRLAFELLNEITSEEYCEKWNTISHSAIQSIRTISKDVTILIGGYHNNHISALRDLDMPYDENIVYNFHCYEPVLFTHQHAYWVEEMKNLPNNLHITFPDKVSHYIEIADQYTSSALFDYKKLNVKEFGTDYFEELFKEGISIADERNVRLYCGEFGVIDQADIESTLNWYRDIHAVFEKYGIGHAAWTYKGKDYGLIDIKNDEARNKLIQLL